MIDGSSRSDNLYSGPGDDFVNSFGDNTDDCGDGFDTVKKGSDRRLDSFVNCERLVG